MIHPAPGYILIEPLDNESTTSSGLLLAENSKDKPIRGRVIILGNDLEKEKFPVKIGDLAIFKKWGGQDVSMINKQYKLVKFDEILGVDDEN